MEVVESDERRKDSAPGDGRPSTVGLPQVARVLSQVYGDRMASHGGGGAEAESFPLQQKLLVCCLLLLTRSGRSKEVLLGKVTLTLPPGGATSAPPSSAPADSAFVCACVFQLHEVYSRLCARRQVSAVGQGECSSLCSLLESRGIVALRKAKEARLTKVGASSGRPEWAAAPASLTPPCCVSSCRCS